jgi:PqqD family protein of HPr-rel-A system
LWKRSRVEDIVWNHWDDAYVAYHRRSGSTHLLNVSSAILIEDILQEPKSAAEVAEELQISGTGDSSGDPAEEIRSMLEHMEELGLIDRCE